MSQKLLHEIKADSHRKVVAKAENARALHESKTGDVKTFSSMKDAIAVLRSVMAQT